MVNEPPVIFNVSVLPVVRLPIDSLSPELIVTVAAEVKMMDTASPAPGTLPVLQFSLLSQFEFHPPVQATADSNCRCSKDSIEPPVRGAMAATRPVSFFDW